MNKVAFRRTRLVVSALMVSTVAVVGVSSQAGAGSPALIVDPTTVEAGGTINVSQYCSVEDATATVGVSAGWTGAYGDPAMPPVVEQSGIEPVGGQWVAQLTIPGSTAPGSYTVWATCGGSISRYSQIELTVIASTTTTTTTAPTSTSTSTTPGSSTTGATTTTTASTPAARPAAAVAGQPTYTG